MVLPNSDETKVKPTPQEPGQVPAEQTPEPEYVTKQYLEEFEGRLKDSLSKNFRAVQGQTDRYQSEVKTQVSQVEAQLKDLRDRGLDISDAQIKQISRDAAVDALLAGEQLPTNGTVPGQETPAAPANEPVDFAAPVNDAAADMEKAAGVSLDEQDPELVEVNKFVEDPNPLNYLKAYEQALQAKKERTSQALPARMAGLTTGGNAAANPLENLMDSDSIWNEVKKSGQA